MCNSERPGCEFIILVCHYRHNPSMQLLLRLIEHSISIAAIKHTGVVSPCAWMKPILCRYRYNRFPCIHAEAEPTEVRAVEVPGRCFQDKKTESLDFVDR